MKGCTKDKKDGKECNKDGKDKDHSIFFTQQQHNQLLSGQYIPNSLLLSKENFPHLLIEPKSLSAN